MTVMVVVVAAVLVLVVALLLVARRRRPARGIESQGLSAYHDGLDALTRLDARRVRPE
jgi:hypothetical protein